jgi:hypothetical protein
MASIQESRERKRLFFPSRDSLPLPGAGGGGLALLRDNLRGDALGLVAFVGLGLLMFLFGLAGTVGPWRDGLRAQGDPRFFYALLAFSTMWTLMSLRMLQVVLTGAGHAARRKKNPVDPVRPWASDYPWQPSGMDPEGTGGEGGAILGRVGFFLFIAIVNLAWASGSLLLQGILVVVDLFALAILYDSFQHLWQAARGPRPRIVWLTFPAFTGSRLEAAFRIRRRLRPTGPVHITLRCVQDDSQGGPVEPFGIYEQVSEVPLPEDRSAFDSVRIDLAVPADLPGTDLALDRPVYWQLLVRVPILGPDFEAVFLAPVYARPEPA